MAIPREEIARLSRDLRQASETLSDAEARYLVDAYYIQQEDRKRSHAQERALDSGGEPHAVIAWLAEQSGVLEREIVKALDTYSGKHVIGTWMRGVYGIGPVIAAGFLAHIYMGEWCSLCRGRSAQECTARQQNKKLQLMEHFFTPVVSCPTVGHIWAYAGMAGDQQKPWERGQKRPWNSQLKTLCWKASDVFVKFSNNERCFYGQVYRARKQLEVERNDALAFKPIAEARLQREAARGKKTAEHAYHAAGLLSPGHLDLRARRYAVKLFLAHLHGEWYRIAFGEPPPLPYPIAHLGHTHIIPPPT